MAIPVGEYESLAQQVLEVYNEAELTMIRRVARRLLKGVNAPGWAERKLSETAQVHHQLSELLAALTRRFFEHSKPLGHDEAVLIDDRHNVGDRADSDKIEVFSAYFDNAVYCAFLRMRKHMRNPSAFCILRRTAQR